jgi:uncharacterized membrane protein YdjX (TVP38/TMEM64 family)
MIEINPVSQKKEKRNQSLSIILSTVLFMVVIGVIVAFDLKKIEAFIGNAGIWGILISVIIYASLGMTFIPSEPLTLLIGAIFGPWVALFTSCVGNTMSAVVEYYLGRRIGSAANFIEQKEKLPFGLGKLKVDSPWFLIGGRIIPLYGAKIVSVLAGIYHVPIVRYIWTTAIPVFIGSAMFAFGGFGLGKLLK